MAIDANLFYNQGYFAIDLYPSERRERIEDEPPDWDPSTPFIFRWDGPRLERNEYEFLGVTVLDLDRVTDADLEKLRSLDLPRVTVLEAGIIDVKMADVFRWAKQRYHGHEVHWPGRNRVALPRGNTNLS